MSELLQKVRKLEHRTIADSLRVSDAWGSQKETWEFACGFVGNDLNRCRSGHRVALGFTGLCGTSRAFFSKLGRVSTGFLNAVVSARKNRELSALEPRPKPCVLWRVSCLCQRRSFGDE